MPTKYAASFGKWLRARRKALDLTQFDLADQVGCSARHPSSAHAITFVTADLQLEVALHHYHGKENFSTTALYFRLSYLEVDILAGLVKQIAGR